jgi:type I restriction enzyme, S subunit
VTVLPKGWAIRSLSQIAEVRLGRQRSPKNHSGDSMHLYLRAANVTWEGLDLDDVKSMNFTDAEMEIYRLRPGDLLLSEASGSAGEVGKPAIWSGEIDECAFQNTLIRVRPNAVLPRYLLHYFKFQALVGNFVPEARGVGINHLGRARLAGWRTPVPPPHEQRRIVEILEDHLSRLDAAIRLIEAARRRLEALERSLKQRAIDGPRSPMIRLGDLVERIEAGRSLGGSAPPADPDEWGIIKVSAMTWGEFRESENKRIDAAQADSCYEIHAGDILVSRANTSAYVGASVFVDHVRPKLLLSDKSLRVVPRRGVEPEWLNQVLQAPTSRRRLSAMATGTKDSMRNISQKSLLSLEVPNTPSGEQYAVVAACRVASNMVNGLGSSICRTQTRSNALRRSLLAAAFAGRLTGESSDMDQVEELAGV